MDFKYKIDANPVVKGIDWIPLITGIQCVEINGFPLLELFPMEKQFPA